MARSLTRILFVSALLSAVLTVSVDHSSAVDTGYQTSQLDLFHNYYVGPGYYGYGIPAKMYLSPRPTPAWVGHTYVTYQPLMPHEFLYKHHRTYIRRHQDGSATRTRVKWY